MTRLDLTSHCETVRVPRLVTTEPVRLNRALTCGNREQFDAFADEMLARERQRALDAQAEMFSEGRRFRPRHA